MVKRRRFNGASLVGLLAVIAFLTGSCVLFFSRNSPGEKVITEHFLLEDRIAVSVQFVVSPNAAGLSSLDDLMAAIGASLQAGLCSKEVVWDGQARSIVSGQLTDCGVRFSSLAVHVGPSNIPITQ